MSEDDKYLSNPFWQRKMKTLFALSSGSKEKAQKEELIHQIGVVTGTEEKVRAEFNKGMSNLKDPEDGVDYDTFLQNILTCIRMNLVASMVEDLFGAMDCDKDGVVGPDEYEKFLKCFNADTSKAKDAFSYIDANKNGVLSKAEFQKAIMEFHTCLDEDHPSKFVFGALVD